MSKEARDRMLEVIDRQEPRFRELSASSGNAVDFAQECLFAKQQILKNGFALETAARNQGSLQAAILNVSAIGISLNPALQHAYLVPRDGAIHLDISYRGLVKIATEAGAIKWAKAELVYANDTFEWRGSAEPPLHTADVFGAERGDIVGGYVLARLPDGDHMVEIMPIAEIYKVRDTSKAYGHKKGPWVDWPEEMMKKTLIKRASKSWPQSAGRDRMDRAIAVLNEHEGMAYTLEEQSRFLDLLRSKDATGLFLFMRSLPVSAQAGLFNSFEKGRKTAEKEAVRALQTQGGAILHDAVERITELAHKEDPHGIAEVMAELSDAERDFVTGQLPPDVAEATQEAAA